MTAKMAVTTAVKASLKTKFASSQTLSVLFRLTQFVKCCQFLLELNSQGHYPGSKREIKHLSSHLHIPHKMLH